MIKNLLSYCNRNYINSFLYQSSTLVYNMWKCNKIGFKTSMFLVTSVYTFENLNKTCFSLNLILPVKVTPAILLCFSYSLEPKLVLWWMGTTEYKLLIPEMFVTWDTFIGIFWELCSVILATQRTLITRM